MKKFTLAVLLLASGFSALAEIKPGTGTIVEFDGLKYEILATETPAAALSVQGEECPTYVRIPETISLEDNDGETLEYAVIQINNEAFMANKDLFKIKFANSITDIGDRAFKECEILTFDELPDRLETIGEEAFAYCNALKRIKLPESTSRLGKRCFADMASLKRAILFSAVTEIPWQAFISCHQLEEVYLPEALVKIGSDAFAWTEALNEITLPETLEEIGDHAFIGGAPSGEGLKSIVLPASVKSFGLGFRHSGLLSVDLSNLDIEEIPERAFDCCYELRQVIFPKNLKKIGREAFTCCGASQGRFLNEVILPNSVETIEEYSFYDTNAVSLTIGDNVTDLPIGSCGRPTKLHIGSRVKTMDPQAVDFSSLKIFSVGCHVPPTVKGGFPLTAEQKRAIALIVPDADAKELYESHENWKDFAIATAENSSVSVHLDGTTDIATAIHKASGLMPANITRLTVSGHLTDHDLLLIKENMLSLMYLDMAETDNTVIPAEAFKDKTTLEKVVLPRGLKRIESEAFMGCCSMQIDELPDGIEYIGYGAFYACLRLAVSKMPQALVTIESEGFENCVSLSSLTFGENLESLGDDGTFRWCENIEFVDLSRATKLKELPGQVFTVAYKMHTILLPEGLERLCGGCISETAVKTIELPGTLKSLEHDALVNTNLRVITFGEGIEDIPENALSYNRRLLTVNLPASLKSLHEASFKGSKNIAGISCFAPEAPEASAATFEDINTRSCILSVPVNSFYSYLSALGWGMFSNISNTLEINIPEEVEITTIPEEDYQDLAEEEESQQREQGVEQPQTQSAGKKFANKQRETTKSLLGGQLFCRLNHGSVLASDTDEESKGNRVFIRTKDGSPIISVTVNGQERVQDLDSNNSLLLPAGSLGKLVVNGGKETSTREIADNHADADTPCSAYSLTGQLLYTGPKASISQKLPAGVYIIHPHNGAHPTKLLIP